MIIELMKDYGPDVELQIEVDGKRTPITSCSVEDATVEAPTHNGLAIVIR